MILKRYFSTGLLFRGTLALLLTGIALASVALASVADESKLDGSMLYTELGCVYCHGPAGKEPVLTEYPKLAGQNKEYLLQQIFDIKSTARKNGYTGMMQPAILSISDEEFAAIAAYLAAL